MYRTYLAHINIYLAAVKNVLGLLTLNSVCHLKKDVIKLVRMKYIFVTCGVSGHSA